jgi:integrase
MFRQFDQCVPIVFGGSIGPCKTEISQQPVSLDQSVGAQLREWRLVCGYPKATDWIFASTRKFGKEPVWPDSIRQKILQPIVRKVGITKRIGWHPSATPTAPSWPTPATDVRVVQELMRHAKVSTTMTPLQRWTRSGSPSRRRSTIYSAATRTEPQVTSCVPKLFPEM